MSSSLVCVTNASLLFIFFRRVPAKVPYGLAACPGDLFSTIRPFAEYKYKVKTLILQLLNWPKTTSAESSDWNIFSLFQDIVQFTYMPKAGHFFAFEEPQMLVEDFLSFVHKVEARDRIVYPSWIQSDAKIVKTAEPPKQETRRDSQGKKERPRQETKEADKVTSKEQKAKDTKKTQKSDKDSKDGKKRQKSNNEWTKPLGLRVHVSSSLWRPHGGTGGAC